jgi:galactose oxidase
MSFANGAGGSDYADTFVTEIPNGMPPSSHLQLSNVTTNLFCGAHSFLSDGRMIVMGGHEGMNGDGSPDVNILNYQPDYDWQRQTADPMVSGRWYPSSITLQNGEILVVGGERKRSEGLGVEPMPEVWQPNAPAGAHWRALTAALKTLPLYSALYLAPSGKVFVPGPLRKTFYLDPSGTGSWSGGPLRLHAGARDYGSSAMYEPGKVLIMGGGGTRSNPVTNTAEIIDLNASGGNR